MYKSFFPHEFLISSVISVTTEKLSVKRKNWVKWQESKYFPNHVSSGLVQYEENDLIITKDREKSLTMDIYKTKSTKTKIHGTKVITMTLYTPRLSKRTYKTTSLFTNSLQCQKPRQLLPPFIHGHEVKLWEQPHLLPITVLFLS